MVALQEPGIAGTVPICSLLCCAWHLRQPCCPVLPQQRVHVVAPTITLAKVRGQLRWPNLRKGQLFLSSPGCLELGDGLFYGLGLGSQRFQVFLQACDAFLAREEMAMPARVLTAAHPVAFSPATAVAVTMPAVMPLVFKHLPHFLSVSQNDARIPPKSGPAAPGCGGC